MPLASLADFWSLLGRTRLVEPEAVAALEQEHAANPGACGGADPKGVAAWLVDRGVLTRWQAKRVGIGNEGPFFLGDYRLLERHDRDGDSLLFTARHEPSGKIVSVVLLNAKRCKRIDVWTEIVHRTTAATKATDPLLSRTWSLEQQEPSRFVVCELIEGTNLADELERLGPLPEVQAGVLVSQLARAVAGMHAEDRVHGDLSLDALRREPPPGGVERTGRVRLLQFPLAGDPHRVPLRPYRIEDEADLEALGRRAAFVAPELAVAGSVCDQRSDVYALGAILYALVAGRLPCQGRTPADTLKKACVAGPDPIGGTVSEGMKELVGYLMARDPDARYQTAGEAADAIAACIGLAPAPAAPAARRSKKSDGFIDVGAPVVMTEDGLPDFSRPAAKGAAATTAAEGDSAVAREFRRRAARLRLIGGGVTLSILAVTGALVAYRSGLFDPPREPTEVAQATTERRPVIPWPKGDDGPATDDPSGDGSADTEMPAEPAAPDPGGSAEQPQPAKPPKAGVEAAPRQLVVDDDTLPWASPTSGQPPRLAYLPPGSQLILLGRPAALAADDEGELFLKSLGPVAESALAKLAAFAGCDVAEIETVQAGWQAGGPDEVLGGYAVRLVEGRTVVADEAARRAAWGATKPVKVDEETVHVGKPFSFWVPAAEQGRVLVVANDASAPAGAPAGLPGSGPGGDGPAGGPAGPPLPGGDSLIAQIVRQAAALKDRPGGGVQAELPLELEKLVTMLDADRHVTLLGSPHYLLNTGRVVLAGSLAKLADPIDDVFGESLKGAAISVHFADHCYLELDAVASLDVKPDILAGELKSRLDGLAGRVEEYCAMLSSPYGRVLVMRLPTMIRMLVGNMRSGAEGGGAVINALLPRHAGHNLALATELALAQSPGAVVAAAPPTAKPPAAAGALDRLKQPITLVFARDTLEKSIQMVSDEIGVPMEILGGDLQLEGITQNQSFGLEERDKPAEAILRVILQKANPDGKLVFVVRKEAAGEKVYVTTRAAVEKRGETLPPGFEPAPGDDKKKKKP